MTTVADLVNDTRRHLHNFHRTERNRLDGAILAGATSLLCEFDATGIARGSYIAIDDEIFYVWAVSTKTLTVEGGQLGTTLAAHSDNALIEVNPRFPQFAITDALRKEIRSWPRNLFAVDDLIITVTDPAVRGYDLAATGFLHVLSATIEPYTLSGQTSSKSWPDIGFRVVTDMPTADFPSGRAIFFNDLGWPRLWGTESSRRIRIQYAKEFVTSTWAQGTDVETAVGLATSMLDIPSLGAAWRLLSTREVTRTDTKAQGESRRAEEVPPGHIIQTATALKRDRDMRIREEIMALQHRYGFGGAGW